MKELVSFIEARAACRGGPKGRVRKIHRYNDETFYLYIIGNKYCEKVKRQHKSNNVYYAVNIKDRYYSQRCFDVVCISKGEPTFYKLPDDISLPNYNHHSNDDDGSNVTSNKNEDKESTNTYPAEEEEEGQNYAL